MFFTCLLHVLSFYVCVDVIIVSSCCTLLLVSVVGPLFTVFWAIAHCFCTLFLHPRDCTMTSFRSTFVQLQIGSCFWTIGQHFLDWTCYTVIMCEVGFWVQFSYLGFCLVSDILVQMCQTRHAQAPKPCQGPKSLEVRPQGAQLSPGPQSKFPKL